MKTYLTLLALQIKMALKGLTRSGSGTGDKKSFRDISRIIGIVILFLVMAVYMAVIEWYRCPDVHSERRRVCSSSCPAAH